MTKSIWEAKQKIAFIENLRKQIAELTDDEEAIRDTLEGELAEGEFESIISRLLAERAEALAVVEGRKIYIQTLEAANAQATARAEAIKGLIGTAMRAASQDKYQGALGTVSFGRGKEKVEVLDVSKLPGKFLKPVVDKALVNEEALEIHKMHQQIVADVLMSEADKAAALAKLPQIPGVVVRPAEDVLTIRAPSGKKAKAP